MAVTAIVVQNSSYEVVAVGVWMRSQKLMLSPAATLESIVKLVSYAAMSVQGPVALVVDH